MGISQVFDKFYEDEKSGTPSVGSIFWVPCTDVPEVPIVLQVQRASPQEHEITAFEFVEVGAQHFKASDRLPIKRLNLQLHEELIVAKAKRRPCVVIAATHIPVESLATLPEGDQRRQAKHLRRRSFLVAPLYSCSTYAKTNAFGPILAARVKALWYPHLCYLPDFKGEPPGSIARLDRVFPTMLGRGCEPSGLRVTDEVMEVIRSQFLVTCGYDPTPWLIELKELVATCLPAELKA